MASLNVGFVLLPHFTLTPFASLVDVLRLAADEGDRSRPINVNWTVLGTSLEPVRASCGVEIRPWERIGEPSRFDYLVVCGGLLQRDHRSDPELESYLAAVFAAGRQVVGLCTGVFLLGQAGILAGRRACLSWFHAGEFREAFPDVEPVASQLYVVDGPVITCSGGTGAADVGALIVERHLGAAPARKALHILQIESARPASFPQPQPAIAADVGESRLRRIILDIEQVMDRPPSIEAIARHAGVSRRQLERLFIRETGRSPSAFIASMRLRYADWLLRTTGHPLTEIAEHCGFSDSSHLSRAYKAAFGMTPSAARKKASGFMAGERRPYELELE